MAYSHETSALGAFFISVTHIFHFRLIRGQKQAKLLDNHLPSWMDVLESWTWSHEFGSWKIARCGNFVHLCNVAPRRLKELSSFNKASVGQMVKMVAEMVSCCSETLAQVYPSDKKTPPFR